jgi:hypothetical protein
MRNRKFVIAGLSLGLLLAAPQLASADPTLLYRCGAISRPGSYVLAYSLNTPDAVCFPVFADDVKIDLNGHTLTGMDGSLDGTQIAFSDNGAPRIAVEIANGAITGFRRAIELRNCNGCKVSGMRITDNGDGINLGINAVVHHNVVLNSGDDGIKAKREALIHDNLSNDNGSEGISVEKNSIVKNNVTQGNGGTGLELQCPALIVQNISKQNGVNSTNNGGCIYVDNAL